MSEAAPIPGTSIQPNGADTTRRRESAHTRTQRSIREMHTSPRIREREKTPEESALDIAYTINHGASCATTDMVIVPALAAGFGINGETKKPITWKLFTHEAGHYLKGEIIGDFSAVPLTIMVQRFFPGFMDMVSRVIDPIAKPLFERGSRHGAERWGKKHGFAKTDAEVVDRAEEIYQNEIKHLPQAVVWNMFSFPLGVLGQKFFGHQGSYGEIVKYKLLGTAISNVLLIGGRAMFPDKAEKFDRLDGKYVIRPVTRAISSLVGIDSKVVDQMDAKAEEAERREHGSWRKRVEKQDVAAANAAAQPGI